MAEKFRHKSITTRRQHNTFFFPVFFFLNAVEYTLIKVKYIFFLRETKIDVPKNEEIFVKLRGLLPQVKNIKKYKLHAIAFQIINSQQLSFPARWWSSIKAKSSCQIHMFNPWVRWASYSWSHCTYLFKLFNLVLLKMSIWNINSFIIVFFWYNLSETIDV